MKKRLFLSLALVLALVLMLPALSACTKKPPETPETQEHIDVSAMETVKVRILMQTGDEMILELYPQIAPITVQNFVDLATSGFYDGLTFHRIIAGFMIQGGDPKGNGTGSSDKTIKGEFSENGVENDLKHTRGVISMARGNNMDSASCQFFIVHQDSAFLNGKYAAFGKLVEGYDVLDKLAAAEVVYNASAQEKSKPVTPPVINSIRVITEE